MGRHKHCRNCMFYEADKDNPKTGECHKNPPQWRGIDDNDEFNCEFPLVDDDDWCGQFLGLDTHDAYQ